MFKLNNVCFGYQHNLILKNISLNIQPGSFCGIIGNNGAGKSTLASILTGGIKKFTGKLLLQNKDIGSYKVHDLAKIISYIPQQMDIRFPYTCLEIVMMGRIPYKSRLGALSATDLDIVYNSMEMTNTVSFAERFITQLSGGEKQRVFLAKALAQQPKVLFLDEAFSNMDIYYSIKCLNLLKKLVEQGLTVIVIMHDLNLISTFCSSVIMLHQGKVVASGATRTVMRPEIIHQVFNVQVAVTEGNGLAVLPNL